MHDLLSENLEVFLKGNTYSLGILLGILSVALDLVIAIITAANVAIASQLSLHPPRKESTFEGRLLFCMMMQLATAVMSGMSLFLLSFNIGDLFFDLCVGAAFFVGSYILAHHVSQVLHMFGLDWRKLLFQTSKVTILHIASLFLSMLACVSALFQASIMVVWLTISAYYATLMFDFFFLSKRSSINHLDARMTNFSLILFILWMLASLLHNSHKADKP